MAGRIAGDGDRGGIQEHARHRPALHTETRGGRGFGVIGRAEGLAPGTSDREAEILRHQPVERHLRVAGAAEVAVLVVAPRSLPLQFAHAEEAVVLADDRHVDLRETGPQLLFARIVHRHRDQRRRNLGVLEGLQKVKAGVGGADRRLHCACRQIEQGTVEIDALLVDRELGRLHAVAAHIVERDVGIALEGSGIAEQIEIGNVCRLHPRGNGGRGSRRGRNGKRPAQRRRDGVLVDVAGDDVLALSRRPGVIDLCLPIRRQGDIQAHLISCIDLVGRDISRLLQSGRVADAQIGGGAPRRVIRIKGRHCDRKNVVRRRIRIGRADELGAAVAVIALGAGRA